MQKDYKKIIPLRFQNVSYENEVSPEVKNIFIDQIKKRSGLYIYGDSGVGKTHLACALIKYLLDHQIDARFFNTGDFLEKLREEFKSGDDDELTSSLFRDTMDFNGVLIFDDLGAEKITEWSRERLYLIINKKYEDMTPMIFTSNADLEIIAARMGDRVASRIREMTEVVKYDGPDRRLKENKK